MSVPTLSQAEKDTFKIVAVARQAVDKLNSTVTDLTTLQAQVNALTADVVGPASATDNAAARFDTTTGKLLQNSALIIADTTGALSRNGGGGIPIQGTNTNDDASAGNVGEYLETKVASGSAVSLTNNTAANMASRSLEAGDYDISVVGIFLPAATTVVANIILSISTTSATLPTTYDDGSRVQLVFPASFVPVAELTQVIPPYRMKLTSTTTIYAVARSGFSTSTMSVYGIIRARRIR